MDPVAEFTALLWWLMLLSSTAIILQDIGTAVLPRARKREESTPERLVLTTEEDELSSAARRIKRGLQRPTTFRSMQREIAHAIAEAALASKGYSYTRIPESHSELIDLVTQDSRLRSFLREHLFSTSTEMPPIQRRQIIDEFKGTLAILERAESELR